MKLKLLLNIGTKDAPRLGLDPAQAREGDVVDVGAKAAEEMTRRGWATDRIDARPAAAGASTPTTSANAPSNNPAPPDPAGDKKPAGK